jgi:hypothetical protein
MVAYAMTGPSGLRMASAVGPNSACRSRWCVLMTADQIAESGWAGDVADLPCRMREWGRDVSPIPAGHGGYLRKARELELAGGRPLSRKRCAQVLQS